MGQFPPQPVAHDVRDGLYLRPSLAMSRAQAGLHDLRARQYGLQSADRFPPHAHPQRLLRATVTTAQLRARLHPILAATIDRIG